MVVRNFFTTSRCTAFSNYKSLTLLFLNILAPCVFGVLRFRNLHKLQVQVGPKTSVESSFLLRQSFTPRQLSKDNRPIVLLLFLTFLHAKDIWRNIHVFQHGPKTQVYEIYHY